MSLDDKLKEIHLEAPEECEVIHSLSKGDIAQIKQAFADKGYVKIPQVELSTRNDNIYKPTAEIFTVNGKEVMTGQEWRSNFIKELNKSDFYPASFEATQAVLYAAKKAAGL